MHVPPLYSALIGSEPLWLVLRTLKAHPALSGKRGKLMKTLEMVKLVGLGYKKSDIKELSELEKENPDALQLALSGQNLTDVKELISLSTPADGSEPKGAEPGSGETDTTDYKKLYEDLKNKNDDLEATIKEIQKTNTSEESGETKSLMEEAIDILSDAI